VHADGWICTVKTAFSWPWVLSVSQASLIPSAAGTAAVAIVEKVTFQKLIFEKRDSNLEKRLVLYVSNNILAIFEPVVGDLCEHFSI